jgi:cytochrome c oxidase subunit II
MMKFKSSLWIVASTVIVGLAAGGIAFESAAQSPKVVKIAVKKFEYDPATVTLKKGEPVVLELTTLDRLHGFSSPDLNLHADVAPNKTMRVELTPTKAGSFPFLCDIFCGTGHGDVKGTIVVTE